MLGWGQVLALFLLNAFATFTIWVGAFWPQALFQTGAFVLCMPWWARRLGGWKDWDWDAGSTLLLWMPVWAGLQMALGFSRDAGATVQALLAWLALFCLYRCGRVLLKQRERRSLFLTLFAGLGAVLSVVGPIQYFGAGGKVLWLIEGPYPDMVGPFQSRNNYACFVELCLPVALWKGLREAGRGEVWMLAAAFLYGSILACGSRAGAVLGALEILLVFVLVGLGDGARVRLKRAALVLGAAGGGVAVIMGAGDLWARFAGQDLMQFRRELLQSAVAMFAAQPITGYGLGAFATVYPAYANFDNGRIVDHAHNDWAEWAATGGLPVLVVMVVLVVRAAPRALRSLWGMGIVAVALHALVDYPFQRAGVSCWYFVLMGALSVSGGGQSRSDSVAAHQDPAG